MIVSLTVGGTLSFPRLIGEPLSEKKWCEVGLAELPSLVSSNLELREDLRVLLRFDGWTFPILFNFRESCPSKLLVCYNGAVDRARSASGLVFQRSSWIDDFKFSRMHFADPTILDHSDMSIGWGQLSSEQWGIELYVAILDALRAASVIPSPESTLHYGSSAGGHQAIMTACLDRGSNALANNPQTDVTRYWPRHQERLFKNIFDDDAVGTASVAAAPWRFKCVELFKKERYVPNLRIATNVSSERDYSGQLLPFLESMAAVQPSGSRIGLENYWDEAAGHSPLNRKETVRLVKRELSRLA